MPLSEDDIAILTGGLDETSVQQSLTAVAPEDPDQYAKDRSLAREIDTTVESVRNNPDDAKRQSLLKKADLQSLLSGYPVTKDKLKDTEFAALAQDEIDRLTAIEDSYKFLQKDNRSWYEGLGDSMLYGMGIVSESAKAWFYNQRREGLLQRKDSMDPEEYQRLWNENETLLKGTIEAGRIAQSEISKLTPSDMGIVGASARGGAQMVAESGPLMLLSLATRGKVNITAPVLSGKVFAQSYLDALVEGKSHDEAMLYATEQGGLEYLTEWLPNKFVGDIGRDLGKGTAKEKIKDWFATEFIGEQIATSTQTMSDVVHGMDQELANAQSLEEILAIQGERQLITGLSTLFGGGSLAGTMHGIDYVASRNQLANKKALEASLVKVQSSQSQDWLDQHIQLAQSSAMGDRAPDLFKEYLAEFDKEGATVYIKADALGELEGLPDYVVKQLDGTGADVAVPMSDFLTDFARNEDLLNAVRPHVKVREDLMTMDEIASNVKIPSVDKMIERAKEAKDDYEEASRIFDEVKSQLVGTGRQGEQTASLAAELYPAMIVAQKEALASQGVHVTVEQLYKDMGLEIIGPGQEPDMTPDAVMEQEPDRTIEDYAQKGSLDGVEVVDYAEDEAGNVVEIRENAQDLWDYHKNRLDVIEQLRDCISG